MRSLFAAIVCVLLSLGRVFVSHAGPVAETDFQVTSAIPRTDPSKPVPDVMRPIVFGVYDPKASLSQTQSVTLDHKFIFWQKFEKAALRKNLADAQERGRSFMLTIEPFTTARNWRDGGDHLFRDILAGKFDRNVESICHELAAFDGDVLVRWGHEMEDPTGRYPWARQDAAGYKAAFRHVVGLCRKRLPLAQFVWSPKGEKNLSDYYPGDDVVDIVGVSVWGLQRMDQDYYARNRSMFDVLGEKYLRVSQFGKPVYVAEFGFQGDKNYRGKWIAEASDLVALHSQFPLLKGLVYFNDREPQEWPQNYGKPDWRIQSETVDAISHGHKVSVTAQALQLLASQLFISLASPDVGQFAYFPSVALFLLRPALT